MADRYKVVIAPLPVEQLEELGLTDRARKAIRDARVDPGQAGKQLTGSLYPYRRLKVGRCRIIYRVAPEGEPREVLFLYCGIRQQGSRKDVYERLRRMLKRGELE